MEVSIVCQLWGSNNNLSCCYKLGGKSAILTAIAVALGGKATSTGRGTGLKSFIKEGETYVILFYPLRHMPLFELSFLV